MRVPFMRKCQRGQRGQSGPSGEWDQQGPHVPHGLRTWAAALAAALLVACGPNSGGTGTGDSLTAAGATAANLCASAFAEQLACGTNGNLADQPGGPGKGTDMIRYADFASGGNVTVTFEANQVQLSARCQGLWFRGDWGLVNGVDARFFGIYGTQSTDEQPLATLSVRTALDSTGALEVLLRDGEGRVLLGPVLLEKATPAMPQPSACR